MPINHVRAGRTHTGAILGYCPDCTLYHASPAATVACMSLRDATGDVALEADAWKTLKSTIEAEGPHEYVQRSPSSL